MTISENLWSEIRSAVREGTPLEVFSREHTKNPQHPPIAELQLRMIEDPVKTSSQTLNDQLDDAQLFRRYLRSVAPSIAEAIPNIDFQSLAEFNPTLFAKILRDFATIAATIADSERKTMVLQEKLIPPTEEIETEIEDLGQITEENRNEFVEKYFNLL